MYMVNGEEQVVGRILPKVTSDKIVIAGVNIRTLFDSGGFFSVKQSIGYNIDSHAEGFFPFFRRIVVDIRIGPAITDI